MMGELLLGFWQLFCGILLMGWELVVAIANWLMNLWL